jgi:hypothetical protein
VPSARDHAGLQCTPDPGYRGLWELAEASAAVEVELRAGERSILALADSGNHGDAMLWAVPSGPPRALRLELDERASDDTEGAAWRDGHLYTLTSSGAVRRYSPSSRGELVLDRPAYPLGQPPYVCDDLHDGNCGKNYEGLCLRSVVSPGACAGYAASKTEGALYCLAWHGDSLVVDASRSPRKLDLRPNALSDCAFGSSGGLAAGSLVVTTNLYGGGVTYLVDERSGALAVIDVGGLLNTEAVAVDREGALYLFMDGDAKVSPTSRAFCTGWPAQGAGG